MLINPVTPQFAWKEPWFFMLRSSSRVGWTVRGVIFVIIYGLFAAMIWFESKSPSKPEFDILAKLFLPLVISAMVIVLYEFPLARRAVNLTKTDICTGPDFPMGVGVLHLIGGFPSWNRKEIKTLELLRPGEPGNPFPFGLMVITPKYDTPQRLGVGDSLSMEELASNLHAMQIPVILFGWNPTTAANRNTPADQANPSAG